MNSATLAAAHPLPDPAPGVRAWTCDLARDPADVAQLATLLAPAETARMDRFGRDDLRLRYVVGRATLRVILGTCLGIAPRDVTIVRGRRGRPQLAPHHASDLDFNLSHTRGTALFGVTTGRRIGVDIEHGERSLNVDGVARKFMSPAEQAALADLEGDARRRAILLLWTCKEAMSKATGDALAAPFRDLDVRAVAQEERTLAAGPAPYTPADWRLHPVAVGHGFIATAALWASPPAADHAARPSERTLPATGSG